MKIMKQRIILLLITLICIVSMNACTLDRTKQLTLLESEESEQIKKQSAEIIRCLTNNDRDGFCTLFCDKIKQSDTFNKQVDALFEFFSCDAYIKSEIIDSACGGESSDRGKRTEWYVTPEITYIKVIDNTDNNKEYVEIGNLKYTN